MELRHLRYFVAVAEELNIRRAAARLHVSQPPLTRQIRDLEDEIGVKLLERSKRGVQLTGAGRVLAEARGILSHSERATRLARGARPGENGHLDVAVPPMALDRPLSRVMRQFRRRFPNLAVQLHEMSTLLQFKALADRDIDLAYCAFSFPRYGSRFQAGASHRHLRGPPAGTSAGQATPVSAGHAGERGVYCAGAADVHLFRVVHQPVPWRRLRAKNCPGGRKWSKHAEHGLSRRGGRSCARIHAGI